MVNRSVLRGDLWWADINPPAGSEPGYRRPVLIVQSDEFNRRSIGSVIVTPFSSHIDLARFSGNLLLRTSDTQLDSDSVLLGLSTGAIHRPLLTDWIASLSQNTMSRVEAILGQVLDLPLE